MITLGGSIFIRNAIKFDYCIKESLASLCELCDEVSVLDAESDDDTLDLLHDCAKTYKNLYVYSGGNWNCVNNYNRLRLLADEAKNKLNTDWHFMLQGDEVIHESSFSVIRKIIEDKRYDSYFNRRYNFFGNLDHYIRFDAPQNRKPCSDAVIRLAHTKYNAFGDAEVLQVEPTTISDRYIDEIKIFHYGMVRKDANFISKSIEMQGWFSGEGSPIDHRIIEMSNVGKIDWTQFKTKDDLAMLTIPHPKFSIQWVEERRKTKPEINL